VTNRCFYIWYICWSSIQLVYWRSGGSGGLSSSDGLSAGGSCAGGSGRYLVE